MTIRELLKQEICRELFRPFIRRQVVNRCWRKIQGDWVLQDIAFVDDWTEPDYEDLIRELGQTIEDGGMVCGAFAGEQLKGFASMAGTPLGSAGQYMDLTNLYVSADCRREGIGKALFSHCAAWAQSRGAEKLYLSAHSAEESQSFYRSMGCREAEEYSPFHVAKEPCDCQMECLIGGEHE